MCGRRGAGTQLLLLAVFFTETAFLMVNRSCKETSISSSVLSFSLYSGSHPGGGSLFLTWRERKRGEEEAEDGQKLSRLSFLSNSEESVKTRENMATCLQNAVFTSHHRGQKSISILPVSYPKCADGVLREEAVPQHGYSAKLCSFKAE